MPTFVLRKLESVVGRQPFYELQVDGVSNYEAFMEVVGTNAQYLAEVRSILTYMNLVAQLQVFLPKAKFREITPAKDSVKEYEFKSDHLRVYAFHLETKGKIVAYWGFKNTQEKDIRRFRTLKRQFLENL